MSDKSPKISIVTPSYNQGEFLEETILSILTQNYPNIEYIVIDGGSKDESVGIIRKYEDRIAYWHSEHDAGQYDAINQGLAKSTGEIMAWLNSDDKYTPWAFSVVAEIFSTYPEIEWLTTLYPLRIDKRGRVVNCSYIGGFNRRSFFRGANLPMKTWHARSFIQQESTFWRRPLWERSGGHIDASLKLAADFELWARFFQYADLYSVATPLGGFRKHEKQKTSNYMDEYLTEAEYVLRRYGGRPCGTLESRFRKLLSRIIRSGTRPLNRLPAYCPLNTRLSIFYSVNVLVWKENSWVIRKDYVL